MFLLVFSIVLLILNIYCFTKKKYLSLFIPCMLFLPNYYGFDFSESFPVISVTRIMFIVFYIYAIVNRRRRLTLGIIKSYTIPKAVLFLVAYFVLRIISNLYYVARYHQSIKAIFVIVFEQLLFLVAIYILEPTKDETITTIKSILWTATTLFIIGIFESLTSIKIFDALYTISREIPNAYYIRLGLLRSTTTLGLPNFYGNMCFLILPISMYLNHATKNNRYLIVSFFDVYAMIHSGCRGNIVFTFFILFIYFVLIPKTKSERATFLKNCIGIILVLALVISLFCASDDLFKYYYTGSAKSILNEIGFNFDLNEGAPPGVDGYGQNQESANMSRIEQFTGIPYSLRVNPFFGLGSGAQDRNEIMYFHKGKWRPFSTYDVGLVEIITEEGLFGLIGLVCLFLAILYNLLIIKRSNIVLFKILIIEIITYLLSTLCTVNMYDYLLLITIAVLYTMFLSQSNPQKI